MGISTRNARRIRQGIKLAEWSWTQNGIQALHFPRPIDTLSQRAYIERVKWHIIHKGRDKIKFCSESWEHKPVVWREMND